MNGLTPKTDVTIQIEGQDGNVFFILGAVSKALKRRGHYDLAREVAERVMSAGSYDEAFGIFMEYVTFE